MPSMLDREALSVPHVDTPFDTGEPCPRRGWYRFDRYLDGTSAPSPAEDESEIYLKGGRLPPIKSTGRRCRWKRFLKERRTR